MSDEWHIIHSYLRADALADGALIDIPEPLRVRAGFRAPTAMTRAVYLGLVWDHSAATAKDENIRREFTAAETAAVRDLLNAARRELAVQARSGKLRPDADRIKFTFKEERVILHLGPGDDGELVITFMTRQDA